MLEADLLGQLADQKLVLGKSVRVCQHDGERSDSLRVEGFEVGFDFSYVEGFEDFDGFAADSTDDLTSLFARVLVLRSFPRVALFLLALFIEHDGMLSVPGVRGEADQCHSFSDLDHLVVQGRDAFNVQVKDLGSRLVADAE